MQRMNEKNANHYEIFNTQPIDYMEQEKIYGYVSKIFKYIVRYPFKFPDDKKIDLGKALYTLNKMIEKKIPEKRVDFTPFIADNWEILSEKQILMLCCLGAGDYINLRNLIEKEMK